MVARGSRFVARRSQWRLRDEIRVAICDEKRHHNHALNDVVSNAINPDPARLSEAGLFF